MNAIAKKRTRPSIFYTCLVFYFLGISSTVFCSIDDKKRPRKTLPSGLPLRRGCILPCMKKELGKVLAAGFEEG